VGALTHLVHFDYGFFGVMTPVLVSLPAALGREGRSRFFAERLCMLTLALALLSLALGLYEYLCLLAVPLIALYSGKRGRYRLKYFFYAFYPVHLALLYGIRMLLL
jgi:hypothetical protein